MVSKPVAPPWNDSSKNLVKDLALAGTRFRYRVLTARGYALPARVVSEPLYPEGAGAHTPPLIQNLRVLSRLLRHDDAALAHFFFAPNPRTSLAARLALRLRPRRTVQTVCSTPASYARVDRLLFADRVVVLSSDTDRRLVEAGVDPKRLAVIPPGIEVPDCPSPGERRDARRRNGLPLDRPVIIYPGDYQFSRAADTFARAIPLLADVPATFVFACRIKQPASLVEEARIRSLLAASGALGRVRMLREVADVQDLLRACDLCVLPAESLYAKMDLPLVLLEAMALGVPVVVSSAPPLVEILHGDVGVAVSPQDAAELAAAIRLLLATPDRLRQLGENARAEVEARYAIHHVARQYEDLYQELIRA
jgi:phosphatidylinositol alpha-1,6-mannosyltransferase